MQPRMIRCTLLAAICLLGGVYGSASAQDAQQVLRLWVGYNTAKNTSLGSLDDAKKAEIARLETAAQAANASKNYGEAMKDYYHAMSLLRGMEWTPSRALGFGLKVTLD